MSFTVEDTSRIGRKAYWTAFVINISLVVALMLGCVFAAISGHFVLAAASFVLILPVAIYFRVVMMRRCRDIGWPAFLPWVLMGAGIVANLVRVSEGVEAMRNPSAGLLPGLVGLIDFGFMIAIGCIDTKNRSGDYARQFYDDDDEDDEIVPTALPVMPRAAVRVPQGYDADAAPQAVFVNREAEEASWDAAIARALEAHQRGGEDEPRRPLAPSVPRPAPGVQRPVGGFGRRVV
ncbi:MAG: DUF805 domain-containing protein [Sphingomonadales bacterium]|nr:DUF805 domain-containing protein [Sphingomonadales bacterium]